MTDNGVLNYRDTLTYGVKSLLRGSSKPKGPPATPSTPTHTRQTLLTQIQHRLSEKKRSCY